MSTSFKETAYYALPVVLQNWLVSIYGAKLYKRRYSSPYDELLDEIENLEQSSAEEILDFKFHRLRNILIHAQEHVPYYHNLFKKINFVAKNIQDLSELNKIPPLEKEAVQSNPDFFLSAKARDISFHLQNTSGSSGRPMSVHVDENTYKRAMALVVYHESINGVAFGKRRATFAGRMIQKVDDKKPPFCRFNRAENQMIFSSYHLSEKTFPWYVRDLNRFQPAEIIGYPSAIYSLAYYIYQSKKKLSFKPDLIVTNSETLLEWQRELIEQALDAPIRDYYGTAEYVFFASECNKRKYHINPALGMIETVDEEDNNIIEVEGDVLCTTLSNFTMPLIRYRVGDRAVLSARSCSCGRHTEILHKVVGRIDDYVTSLDNRKIGRLDHIYKGLKHIKESQIVQQSYDHCVIKLVKADQFIKIDEECLLQNFADRVGSEMKVSIEYHDEIPKGKNGKFRAVINEIQR